MGSIYELLKLGERRRMDWTHDIEISRCQQPIHSKGEIQMSARNQDVQIRLVVPFVVRGQSRTGYVQMNSRMLTHLDDELTREVISKMAQHLSSTQAPDGYVLQGEVNVEKTITMRLTPDEKSPSSLLDRILNRRRASSRSEEFSFRSGGMGSSGMFDDLLRQMRDSERDPFSFGSMGRDRSPFSSHSPFDEREIPSFNEFVESLLSRLTESIDEEIEKSNSSPEEEGARNERLLAAYEAGEYPEDEQDQLLFGALTAWRQRNDIDVPFLPLDPADMMFGDKFVLHCEGGLKDCPCEGANPVCRIHKAFSLVSADVARRNVASTEAANSDTPVMEMSENQASQEDLKAEEPSQI